MPPACSTIRPRRWRASRSPIPRASPAASPLPWPSSSPPEAEGSGCRPLRGSLPFTIEDTKHTRDQSAAPPPGTRGSGEGGEQAVVVPSGCFSADFEACLVVDGADEVEAHVAEGGHV